ncbi:hypothetical protein FQN54_001863 [Arachnomyces sp. PD_36]|nr:hypothetical protein FQN54_001863 [Arachnomyces sp. PD_36]
MGKVALITGGASGMGLAVASALASRGEWTVHILDLNEERGREAASTLPQTTFHKTNVSDYGELAATFKAVFVTSGRLDFVFANAGVIERKNFYAKQSEGIDPPPEFEQLAIDINLRAVISTSYLAVHYFRQSPEKGKGASLVMTSSCGGLYPSYYSPIYTASKFGVVGFMRAVAGHFHLEGIRANAICPGIVPTNLVDKKGWANFPQDLFTPVEKISQVTLNLVDGVDMTDANGNQVAGDMVYGKAVEINRENYYFRDQVEYCDDAMRKIMEATKVDNQVGGVLTS